MSDDRYCLVAKQDGSIVLLDHVTMTFSYCTRELQQLTAQELGDMIVELNKLGNLLKDKLFDDASIAAFSVTGKRA